MECLKACPHRSIEFRLRLPGVELWTSHKPLLPEVCLMFMLLGAVYLHDADDVLLQLGLAPDAFLGPQLPHILTSAVFLALPGALAWGVDSLWRGLAQPARQELVPALGASGAASGGGGGGGGSSSDSSAIATLQRAATQQTAAAAPLRPFIELAYGGHVHVYCCYRLHSAVHLVCICGGGDGVVGGCCNLRGLFFAVGPPPRPRPHMPSTHPR
jgi:hypothetical protein